ncbi:MAG: DinB family protein [Phycisphaerales bacterium]|nr:DinB family protein [Phycisphaerales bacterium]
MNTTTFIRQSLENSKGFMMGFFADLKGESLAQPTVNGGNHALWILGHLVYSECSITHSMILGKESCPLQDWKDLFGYGSEPKCDASIYPDFDELLAKWEEVRAFTLSTLDSMSDDDLDKPAPGCPEEWAAFFGTIGLCFGMKITHPMMHYGQLADIRRSLGRPVMMA